MYADLMWGIVVNLSQGVILHAFSFLYQYIFFDVWDGI